MVRRRYRRAAGSVGLNGNREKGELAFDAVSTMPVGQALVGILVEHFIFGSRRRLVPACLAAEHQVGFLRWLRQNGVDCRGERVHQLGPARVENPQSTAAVFAKMALGRTGVAFDDRMIYRTLGLTRYLESFIFGAKVDCKPATACSFATNRAITEIVRIGMRRIDFEFDRSAMTRTLEFHRIICLPK